MNNDSDSLSKRSILKSIGKLAGKGRRLGHEEYSRSIVETPLTLYRKSGDKYVRCDAEEGGEESKQLCDAESLLCPGKLNIELIAVLCWIVRNIGVEVEFTMQDVFVGFHLDGGPVDISDSLLSYHINLFIQNGVFRFAGALESDKRRRVYVITEHGEGCLRCILRLINGDFGSPLTEDQMAKQCVLKPT